MPRLVCVTLAVLLMSLPVVAAEKKKNPKADWPKPAAIEKVAENVKYLTNRQVSAKYRGRPMTFIPADISDVSDEQKLKGFIFGKLVSEGASADGLPAGQYVVYVRKPGPAWEAYFTQKHVPEAKSTHVKSMDENYKDPEFAVDNTTFRYWRLQIAY